LWFFLKISQKYLYLPHKNAFASPFYMKIPASYRYYTLSDLLKVCQIDKTLDFNILAPVEDLTPLEFLEKTLQRNMLIFMNNEKAKAELIVSPILVEIWDMNQNFKPLSGLMFNIDKARGLRGRCDFLISANPFAMGIESPIMCVFEAKNDAIEDWYGQCGAEMFAVRLFNEQQNKPTPIVYGAITNGFTWQFLRLENKTLFIDSQRYGTANLPQLLGAIQKIYNYFK
jgi:hypothetical protein